MSADSLITPSKPTKDGIKCLWISLTSVVYLTCLTDSERSKSNCETGNRTRLYDITKLIIPSHTKSKSTDQLTTISRLQM